MGLLSFMEKQTICRLFGISNGYVFKFWSDKGCYNKNKTHELILESCGINIYADKPYNDLSQQKCIEKIWALNNPQMTANLLSSLSKYFCFAMGTAHWSEENCRDYHQVEEIIKRLRSTPSISLPQQESSNLKLILADIETNVNAGKPELVIDRLHTFATKYIRELCQKHDISISDDKGNYHSLDSLIAKLKTWYERENYFESEFCVVAIRNTINIFSKYNDLRNSRSAAHPNQLLKTAEAEYAVKIIADTLMFIDKIEESNSAKTRSREESWLYINTEQKC